MKVIDLGKRIIFTDDIQYIYNAERCGEYHDYTEYYVVTKVGKFNVEKYEYEKVKNYLLSLNEDTPKEDTMECRYKYMEKVRNYKPKPSYLQPKEDKKIKKLEVYDDSIEWCCNGKAITDTEKDIIDKLDEIIDKINGE